MKKIIDPRKLEWIYRPRLFIVNEDKIILETEPFTDLKPARPGAEAIELSIPAKGSFCFSACVDFEFRNRYDQCGFILYKGKEHKALFGMEYYDEESSNLQCIVYHDEYGDKSGRDIGSAIHRMYYRIWYRGGALRMQYSFTGRKFQDFRKFWLEPGELDLSIGIYACSPENSSFDCTFRNMMLEENDQEVMI